MTSSRLSHLLGATAISAAALLVATGCGSSSDAGRSATEAAGSASPVLTRIALAPDPVWEGMNNSGIIEAWEESGNVRVEASNPFDPFSAFVGGHADMVLVNALELPRVVEQSEREPVIVAKVATDRSFLAVNRTSSVNDFDDLIEARIAIDSSMTSTLLWGVISESLHGLDFRLDGADFDLVVVDATRVVDLVLRGDVDACICVPDFSAAALAERRLKPLYGGRSAAEIYAEDVVGDPARRPVADVLVVDAQWYSQNPGAVESLLGMWDEGLRAWHSDRERYLEEYPHLLSIQTDEEISWMTEYLRARDWVSASAYLTSDDQAAYSEIFARLQRLGLLTADAEEPEMKITAAARSGA